MKAAVEFTINTVGRAIMYTSWLYYANSIRLHSFIYAMSQFLSEKYMLSRVYENKLYCIGGPCFTM